MTDDQRPFVLGWEEWVALPDLGLPAVKAKIDTGARTSALHAFLVEPFGGADGAQKVRFGIHPVPGRPDIEIYCSASVVDRREVTSSNGEREIRHVIASTIDIGGRRWPIEITLTNRETMAYRMLLGRQAIREDVFVDPAASFRQKKLSYKLYRHLPVRDIVRRPLRIALLSAQPDRASNRRLEAVAAARGHVLEAIDLSRLALGHFDRPQVTVGDAPLPHYDVILPRLNGREGPLATAAARELELMGAGTLASADAIERLAHPIGAIQILAHRGIDVAPPSPRAQEKGWGRRLGRPVRRLLVVGGDVVAMAELRQGRLRDTRKEKAAADRTLARRAARALGLGLAAVDVASDGAGGRAVARVSAAPDLGAFERATGAPVAEAVIGEIERLARSWVRRGDGAELSED